MSAWVMGMRRAMERWLKHSGTVSLGSGGGAGADDLDAAPLPPPAEASCLPFVLLPLASPADRPEGFGEEDPVASTFVVSLIDFACARLAAFSALALALSSAPDSFLASVAGAAASAGGAAPGVFCFCLSSFLAGSLVCRGCGFAGFSGLEGCWGWAAAVGAAASVTVAVAAGAGAGTESWAVAMVERNFPWKAGPPSICVLLSQTPGNERKKVFLRYKEYTRILGMRYDARWCESGKQGCL